MSRKAYAQNLAESLVKVNKTITRDQLKQALQQADSEILDDIAQHEPPLSDIVLDQLACNAIGASLMPREALPRPNGAAGQHKSAPPDPPPRHPDDPGPGATAQASRRPVPKLITGIELGAKHFDPPRWVVPGLLPEGSALLVGSPKIGKSFIALDICLAVAAGGDLFGCIKGIDLGESIYLALEDNERRLKTRMLARLHGTDIPVGINFQTSWLRTDQGGLDDLHETLLKHPECRVVIVDTLAKIRPPTNGHRGLYEQDYQAMSGFGKLAAEHHCAIVAVHHDRKQEADDILQTVSGSQGLTGAVDTILLMRRQRMTGDAVLAVTGRDIEQEQTYGLKWSPEHVAWTITGTGPEALLSPERRAVLDIVKQHGPISGRDIAAALHPGITVSRTSKEYNVIKKHLQKLTDSRLVNSTKDGYVSLSSLGSLGSLVSPNSPAQNGGEGTWVKVSEDEVFTHLEPTGSRAESQKNRVSELSERNAKKGSSGAQAGEAFTFTRLHSPCATCQYQGHSRTCKAGWPIPADGEVCGGYLGVEREPGSDDDEGEGSDV
jgi:DNA-binding transcriptional ArsR family regulator